MLSLACAQAAFVAPSSQAARVAPSTGLARSPAVAVRMQQPDKLASPIPWLPRPDYLDGTLAADVGFDPLSYVTKYKKFEVKLWLNPETGLPFSTASAACEPKTIVLGPNTKDTKKSLMWMREAEIKHARLAMLAAAGWPLAELWHGPLAKLSGLPYALDVTQGRSLSVLNGGLGDVFPFMLLVGAAISAVEISTLDNVYGLTATGKTMKPNGQIVMKSYVPGDCGFDPLNLYGWLGSNMGVVQRNKAAVDPEYNFMITESYRREMETAEIKNGRLAMLAITGYALQEAAYGTPVVDQTPLFFTFFGDLIAPGAFSSTFGL